MEEEIKSGFFLFSSSFFFFFFLGVGLVGVGFFWGGKGRFGVGVGKWEMEEKGGDCKKRRGWRWEGGAHRLKGVGPTCLLYAPPLISLLASAPYSSSSSPSSSLLSSP